ncbi:hypothetical protein QOZ84_08780 [Romboutsia sedimentorum]|uniref:Uncharacterized protein n=1 Tax=Romboutsia sedimentorum TaxID=1368474 RepID=A0ABT7E9P1_9FIRM|nr:hypothetical protein [Romboutsia sedimentorum]MDK2563644.1 hypothetical protein [Romboutsia sedimentorum]MDK2586007.1 hypothetical protein [Romboutsia sedimentorum]
MTSNKLKMVLSGAGIILLLYSYMLGGESSFIIIMWLIVMAIYSFITALVAEINDKKQRK